MRWGGGVVRSPTQTRGRGWSLEGILSRGFERRRHGEEAHRTAAHVSFYSGGRRRGEADGGGGGFGLVTRVTRREEPQQWSGTQGSRQSGGSSSERRTRRTCGAGQGKEKPDRWARVYLKFSLNSKSDPTLIRSKS
jgi:hypothetical protein